MACRIVSSNYHSESYYHLAKILFLGNTDPNSLLVRGILAFIPLFILACSPTSADPHAESSSRSGQRYAELLFGAPFAAAQKPGCGEAGQPMIRGICFSLQTGSKVVGLQSWCRLICMRESIWTARSTLQMKTHSELASLPDAG